MQRVKTIIWAFTGKVIFVSKTLFIFYESKIVKISKIKTYIFVDDLFFKGSNTFENAWKTKLNTQFTKESRECWNVGLGRKNPRKLAKIVYFRYIKFEDLHRNFWAENMQFGPFF